MFASMTSHSRHLSPNEIKALPADFTDAFNIDAVQLIDRPHNPFAQNKILCRGPRLYWPNYPRDFTRETPIIKSLLVHELCHVWQYETGRLSAIRYLLDPRNWIYRYKVSFHAEFDDYKTEKQADLLQDWFLVNSGHNPLRFNTNGQEPTKDWLNEIVPFNWTTTR